MIKIVNGTFGYNNGGVITPITPKDGPITCSKEIEKRLVEQGVAVFIKEEKDETKPDRGELIKKFKELGLKGNPATIKTDDLIKMIENAPAEDGDKTPAEDGDETPDNGEENKTPVAPEGGEGEETSEGDETPDGEDAPDLGNDDGVVD